MKNLVEKLRKVPGFVQTLLVGLALVFNDLTSSLFSFNAVLVQFAQTLQQSGMDMSGVDLDAIANTLAVMYWIFLFLIGVAVFELIAYLVYRGLYMRRYIDGQKAFVMTATRFTFIALNVAFGLVKLFGFIPGAQYYVPLFVSATLEVILYPTVFTLVFAFLLRNGNVYADRVGNAYNMVFWLWFGITGVLSLFETISAGIDLIAAHAVLDFVAALLQLVLTVLTGLALWFTARKKFMDIQKNPPDSPVDDDQSEIFHGYGL